MKRAITSQEFNKIWNHVVQGLNEFTEGSSVKWKNARGVTCWRETRFGGTVDLMKFPNGRLLERYTKSDGTDVVVELNASDLRQKTVERARAAREEKKRRIEERGDLVIPKEHRDLVERALRVAQIALEEKKQASWVIDLAHAEKSARQIAWLLKRIAGGEEKRT